MGATNVHTQTLNSGTLTVVAANNVLRLSLVCKGGTVLATGSTSFQGVPSSSVSFTVGEGITLTSPNASQPIDGFTIDCTSGQAEIVISLQ